MAGVYKSIFTGPEIDAKLSERVPSTPSGSPLLTLESFQYLVENATNTSAITVTVHADVYAKLTDPQQADWYAVNTAAQGKHLSLIHI